ncbi:MAG: TetR/AcrR family transcriptional regulator [Stomatobaculum sp.]
MEKDTAELTKVSQEIMNYIISLEGLNVHSMTRRKLQALETRNKIFHAAIKIINEKGYDNVNIEDITREAEVAKGSFYTYFKCKADILFFNAVYSDAIYQQTYKEIEEMNFQEGLLEFISISYRVHERRGKGVIKAIISNLFSIPDFNVFNRERILFQCFRKLIEKGKNEGFLSDKIDTEYYVNECLSTLIGGELLWCIDEKGSSLVDIMRNAFLMAIQGMKKQED